MNEMVKLNGKKRQGALFIVFLFLSSTQIWSQLEDDFSDGNYSANPAWSGVADNFIINAQSELQLNDIAPVITQSYLNTDNFMSSLNDKEWRIRIKQTFSGSDANQSRIYLTSNAPVSGYSANNSAGVQGYFLKLGEGLSGDVVRFYKDDGINTTLIASCTTSIANSFNINLQILRDNSGNWSIGIDPLAGENFIEETSFSESSFNTSGYFSVVCTYTSSNANKFFFDDIYAGNIIVDSDPPIVLSATATSASTVDLLFNEPVDEATSETAANYNVPGISVASNAIRDNVNNALVHVTFSGSFTLNQEYAIEVSAVEDIFGNMLSGQGTAVFQWYVLGIPEYHDIIFNEILADPTPSVSLPEAEFLELYNTHPENTFNLADWTFVNTTTEDALPPILIAPGEYLILCDENNTSLFEGYGDVIGIAGFSALSNTGDSLTLRDNLDQIIDVVVYSDSWFMTPEKLDGGWSLELINPTIPCQTASNWSESSNASGGTPGAINSVFDLTPDMTAPTIISFDVITPTNIYVQFSEAMDTTGFSSPFWDVFPFNNTIAGNWNGALDGIIVTTQFALTPPNNYQLVINGISDCSGNIIANTSLDILLGFSPVPGDLIINEIMADPDPQILMPAAEYIEIKNNSSNLIDLSEVKLNDGFFTSQTLIQPFGFLVIADESDAASFSEITNAAFMTSFPSLTNSGVTVEMTFENNISLDQVSYNLNWYHDNSKTEGGWSMERINPLAICSGSYNWKASLNEGGGTAGAENSVYSIASNGAPQVTNSGLLSANQLYIRFSESMDVSSTSVMSTSLTPFNSIESPSWNPDKDQVIFNTSLPITAEEVYQLNLTGLTDCDGNQVTPNTLTFLLGLDPAAGDLIINEIMADGTSDSHVASPKLDFVEIYNRTSHFIELSQVSINDGYFDQQVIIYPDSFLVITDVSNDPVNFFVVPNTSFMFDFPSFTEDGMEITLSSDNGLLDRVNYNKSFYNDPDKEDGGYSMELINPGDPCSSSDNWKACINGNGTSAGKQNSVYNITPDTQGPILQYILGEPQESITLVFNEPLDEASFSGLSWTVEGELQTIVNPVLYGDEGNQVILYFGEMAAGQTYHFDLLGIADCWGNQSALIHSQFGLAETAQAGDLIINEILYNPKEGGDDFIEIYNNSLRILSLDGWKLADATSGEMNTPDVISEIGILFFPGEYLAITKETSTLSNFYSAARVDRLWEVKGIPDFSSADEVFLLMPDGEISDHVPYDESLQYPLLNSTDGVSLERISFVRSSTDITNWHSAAETVGFATPGYLNSQSELSLGSDALLTVESEIFSPDNDGYNDVVTFSYKVDKAGYTGSINIYDSEGRFVRHLMRNELLGATGSISWDGLNDDKQKGSIGIYVVYFEAFNPSGSTLKSKKTCVLAHPLN